MLMMMPEAAIITTSYTLIFPCFLCRSSAHRMLHQADSRSSPPNNQPYVKAAMGKYHILRQYSFSKASCQGLNMLGYEDPLSCHAWLRRKANLLGYERCRKLDTSVSICAWGGI